jgi:hypothetical protein
MIAFVEDVHLERMTRDIFRAVTTSPGDLGSSTFSCMWTYDNFIFGWILALCDIH